MDCSLPVSSVHGILQARILEWVAFPFFRGIFVTQGSNPGLPHYRPIFYHLSHGGSRRTLKWVAYPFSREIFPTQEWNWGFLHGRRIMYQLSHQGSPHSQYLFCILARQIGYSSFTMLCWFTAVGRNESALCIRISPPS